MKGFNVDSVLSSLEDVLGLDSYMVAKFHFDDTGEGHYLKMWKFYEENNNPELIRSAPLNLMHKLEFSKNEGYLGLVIFKQFYDESYLPELFENAQGIANLTPRGVCSMFCQDKNPENHFYLFIANGKASSSLVKAILLTRAFELESLLTKTPSILPLLHSGVLIKSKKISKSSTMPLELSKNPFRTTTFLSWIIKKNPLDPLSNFKSYFLNKDSTKLYMNPFGVTLHKPKVSSLSLKNVQTKLQEKFSINEINDSKELENLDIRDTTRNELKLEYYNDKISEIQSGIFISGDNFARNKELLKFNGITHIINCAANVCENYFPEDFQYIKYFIKDSNNYNIESLFYSTFEVIDKVLADKGRVLFHCMQGVSRSVAFCIGYLIYSTRVSYETALETCKKIRQICSPNIGFQVQLIWWYKRLYENFKSVPVTPRVYVIASFDPDQPQLVVAKLLLSTVTEEVFLLDTRSIFIIHTENIAFVWIGKNIHKNNYNTYNYIAKSHLGYLKKYEKCEDFVFVQESEESENFWTSWHNKPVTGINEKWNEWFIPLESYSIPSNIFEHSNIIDANSGNNTKINLFAENPESTDLNHTKNEDTDLKSGLASERQEIISIKTNTIDLEDNEILEKDLNNAEELKTVF